MKVYSRFIRFPFILLGKIFYFEVEVDKSMWGLNSEELLLCIEEQYGLEENLYNKKEG